MKANELRIGNLVDLGNRIAKIIEIGHLSCVVADLEETQDTIEDYERTKPIILTEEWLYKFGFKDIDKGDNDYITYTDSNHDYYLQLDVRKRDGKYSILDNSFDDLRDFSMVDIVYVHQLQNLYFALTGEELTIKQFTACEEVEWGDKEEIDLDNPKYNDPNDPDSFTTDEGCNP
jgi:hypothetical protein